MKENIVFIGFMGVGKGTVARALSRKTGMFTLDSDDLIESMENRKIKKIFEQDGEDYFRSIEAKTAKWLSLHVEHTIISTGGGFFKVNELNNIGKVIYLKSSFDGIINRLKAQPNATAKFKKRPLLQDIVKAKELFDSRYPLYEQKADVIIDVEEKDIDTILDTIMEKIK